MRGASAEDVTHSALDMSKTALQAKVFYSNAGLKY